MALVQMPCRSGCPSTVRGRVQGLAFSVAVWPAINAGASANATATNSPALIATNRHLDMLALTSLMSDTRAGSGYSVCDHQALTFRRCFSSYLPARGVRGATYARRDSSGDHGLRGLNTPVFPFDTHCASCGSLRGLPQWSSPLSRLGIGANSAVFSALDAVLLRPLPFPEGDRLVRIHQRNPKTPITIASPARLADWDRLNETFQAVTGFYTEDASETTGEFPEKLREHSSRRGFWRCGVWPRSRTRLHSRRSDKPAGRLPCSSAIASGAESSARIPM